MAKGNVNRKKTWLWLRSSRTVPFYAGLATFLVGILCIRLSEISNFATIWLGNAVLLVILLRSRRKESYEILLMGAIGNTIASYYMGFSFKLSFLLSLVNLIELLPIFIFVRLQESGRIIIDEFDRQLFDITFHIIVGCFLSAIAGAALLIYISTTEFENLIIGWFAADLAAMLAIVPFGLSVTKLRIKKILQPRVVFEFIFILSAAIAATIVSVVYAGDRYVIIMMPLLIAAFRLGILGTAIVSLFDAIVYMAIFQIVYAHHVPVSLNMMTSSYFLLGATLLPPLIVAVLLNQRKIYAERIQQSEERFRGAMEYSAIGMAIVSLEGKWLELNKALCDITGYSEKELMQMTFKDITYQPDLEADLRMMQEVKEGKRKSYMMEKRYVRKDGRVVWVLLVASAAYDLKGKPQYYVTQVEDIDEKKQIEKSLKESEQRWKYALEGGAQGVWDWNKEKNQIYYSHTWKAMLGYAENDIKNNIEDWVSRIHPDDKDRVLALLHDHFDDKTDEYVSEYRLRCKNGDYKWILDRGKVITRDEQGDVLRIIGTHTDIDSVKQTEMELKKLSQRMALAIQAGKVGIFELDVKNDYLVWDDRMHELYDIPPEIFTHDLKAWSTSIHPDDYNRIVREYRDAINGVKDFDSEFRIITPLGEIRYIRANAVVIRDQFNNADVMLGTNWDITHEKQLAHDLFQEKEKLSITLQSIGDAVVVVNAAGDIEFINHQAADVIGCDAGRAKGNKFDDLCQLISESSSKLLDSPIDICMHTGETFYHEEEVILINCRGQRYFIQASAAPLKSSGGIINGAVMVIHDVTTNRNLRLELEHYATHDALTGLINRRQFEGILNKYLDSENDQQKHVLFYLDLDRFKSVNDTVGHAAGDDLLKQVCNHFKSSIRDSDILARIGGDEFALILPNCNKENALAIANKIIHKISEFKFTWKDKVYTIGVSIGMVEFSPQAADFETIMQHADSACYQAKHKGGNLVYVYDDKDEFSSYHGDVKILSIIKQSIKADRLRLYAHEIRPVDISGVHKPYYEILLRWIDNEGNIMPPSKFIAVAERHNQMAMIDEWVATQILETYAKQIANISGLSVSINLSAKSINSSTFLAKLQSMIESTIVPKSRIGFELTETAVINHMTNAADFFRFIEREGCFVAIDDFGVGLSSFNYLKHFPAKFVKIDGSFIRRLVDSNIDKAIVETINELVHRLGGYTIAEFVESREIMDIVRSIGMDYVQGHYISQARPLEELLNELSNKAE